MTNQNEIPARQHHGGNTHTHRHGSHQHIEGRHSPRAIEQRDLGDDLRYSTVALFEASLATK